MKKNSSTRTETVSKHTIEWWLTPRSPPRTPVHFPYRAKKNPGITFAISDPTPEMMNNSSTHPRDDQSNEFPKLTRVERITGANLIFRDVCPNDAKFIIDLRTDHIKGRYISPTSPQVSEQVEWINRYAEDDSQLYFVILDNVLNPVGTVRLYDSQGDSFCWGSWILAPGTPSSYSIESALIVYEFALKLNFKRAHFEVQKGNISVWKFHERFGAVKSAETADSFTYRISNEAIRRSLERYRKFLPLGITVSY